MDNQAPKPMKKVNRNIFHKVGRRLEKFEQSLVIPSPNLSHGFASSSDISTNSYPDTPESKGDQYDSRSLQNFSYTHTDSPKSIHHHRHGI